MIYHHNYFILIIVVIVININICKPMKAIIRI